MSIYSYKMATLTIQLLAIGFQWPSLWINCTPMSSTERSELVVTLHIVRRRLCPEMMATRVNKNEEEISIFVFQAKDDKERLFGSVLVM